MPTEDGEPATHSAEPKRTTVFSRGFHGCPGSSVVAGEKIGREKGKGKREGQGQKKRAKGHKKEKPCNYHLNLG